MLSGCFKRRIAQGDASGYQYDTSRHNNLIGTPSFSSSRACPQASYHLPSIFVFELLVGIPTGISLSWSSSGPSFHLPVRLLVLMCFFSFNERLSPRIIHPLRIPGILHSYGIPCYFPSRTSPSSDPSSLPFSPLPTPKTWMMTYRFRTYHLRINQSYIL